MMKIKCLSNGLHSLKNCPNPFGKGFSHVVAKICAYDSTKREIAEKVLNQCRHACKNINGNIKGKVLKNICLAIKSVKNMLY